MLAGCPQLGPYGRGSPLSLAPHCLPLPQPPLPTIPPQLHFFLLDSFSSSRAPFLFPSPLRAASLLAADSALLHASPGPHSGLLETCLYGFFPWPRCCCSQAHLLLALSSSSLQLCRLTLHQPVSVLLPISSPGLVYPFFVFLLPLGPRKLRVHLPPFLIRKGQRLLVFFLWELGSFGRKEWPGRVRAQTVSREQVHFHLVAVTWFECACMSVACVCVCVCVHVCIGV